MNFSTQLWFCASSREKTARFAPGQGWTPCHVMGMDHCYAHPNRHRLHFKQTAYTSAVGIFSHLIQHPRSETQASSNFFPCLQEGWDFVPQTYAGTWSVFFKNDFTTLPTSERQEIHLKKKKGLLEKSQKEQDDEDNEDLQLTGLYSVIFPLPKGFKEGTAKLGLLCKTKPGVPLHPAGCPGMCGWTHGSEFPVPAQDMACLTLTHTLLFKICVFRDCSAVLLSHFTTCSAGGGKERNHHHQGLHKPDFHILFIVLLGINWFIFGQVT